MISLHACGLRTSNWNLAADHEEIREQETKQRKGPDAARFSLEIAGANAGYLSAQDAGTNDAA